MKMYASCFPTSFAFLLLFGTFTSAQTPSNAIILGVNPNPAQVKQKITLTANVTNNGSAATGGTVTFLDGKRALGAAQVVGTKPAKGFVTGEAVLTTILAPGSHSLVASYGGTVSSPGVVRSSKVPLTVNGKTSTATVLTAKPNAQNPQNYDLTGNVTVLGFAAPTNTVGFTDITTGTNLGTAPFDSATIVHTYGNALVTQAMGMASQSVVSDFNGDGFPDVATANASFTVSNIAVFLGKANGQFQTPVTYVTGEFTSGIVTGDFNNDGILDIAAMNQSSDVELFLGNGDGTFQTPLDDVIGGTPIAIVMGDFNRDGILDFVTADYFANNASVSLGNGDGTFQPPVPYQAGSGPYSIATADFNGDGFLDLAVVNDNVDTVSVLLGRGDGTFRPQQFYSTGFQVEFVTTGDFNNDGNPDMVVANYGESTVGVLLGNGDGTFQTQVTYPVGSSDSGIAVADLDGDGNLDLAVSYFHPAQLGVLLGNGDGTFGTVTNYKTGQSQGYELSAADLNGDGTPDLISDDLNSSISVLLNETKASAGLTDVVVPGMITDSEQLVAKYAGNARYAASKSAPVTVMGSGGTSKR
jgi:hypothetical protein